MKNMLMSDANAILLIIFKNNSVGMGKSMSYGEAESFDEDTATAKWVSELPTLLGRTGYEEIGDDGDENQ